MLRLPSLDASLAALIDRLAATVLHDTVLLLLADHGTHGIWYATDFEIGAAEHKLPFMYVVAPGWLMRERPGWLAALRANQKRLVTAHEVYQAMRTLAAWPDEPEGRRLSIFDPVPANRSCAEAKVPPEYCACLRNPGSPGV